MVILIGDLSQPLKKLFKHRIVTQPNVITYVTNDIVLIFYHLCQIIISLTQALVWMTATSQKGIHLNPKCTMELFLNLDMKDIWIMNQIKVAMKVMFKLNFVSQDKAQHNIGWIILLFRIPSYFCSSNFCNLE